ncbi:tetratricopeptide repeat protein [Sandaracinus amylolyticus]|uniref:tetratricopeptide repeat protein n=1 Tax=Sandaracinus amylolyticus TaxID=927083 RepID=UPI001F31A3EE|nr:tetratricopeptide repeat protein [Sandaracinus amylolyticus]UJR78321.1 Social gliding motility protein Tgl [Sandaracinus amylolyticus]
MDERTKQLLALGREHYEKREFDKAEHYLRQVLERETAKFADVLNMTGVIHHDRGRFEEAQAAFEEALQINPNYTEAALNLAVTYNDLGRYDEAKRIYQAALARGADSPGQLDPFVKGKIANLHAEVAQAYTDAGMVPDAMHELRKAILLCPTFADLRVKLANLYRQAGDLDAARFELEEAINARPRYVPAYIALGVTLLSMGNGERAMEMWKRALEVDPENKAADMYLRMARGASSSSPPPKLDASAERAILGGKIDND